MALRKKRAPEYKPAEGCMICSIDELLGGLDSLTDEICQCWNIAYRVGQVQLTDQMR